MLHPSFRRIIVPKKCYAILGQLSDLSRRSCLQASSFNSKFSDFVLFMPATNQQQLCFQSVVAIGCAAPRKGSMLDVVLAMLAVRCSFSLREDMNDGRWVGRRTVMYFLCVSVLACMLCSVGYGALKQASQGHIDEEGILAVSSEGVVEMVLGELMGG